LQKKKEEAASAPCSELGVKNNLEALYQSEGYRVESIHCVEGMAQVNLVWDRRKLPRCGKCGRKMPINRKQWQVAMDLPLATASVVAVRYEAVQGFCPACRCYETVRPLEILEHHTATLRLMRYVSRLCRWLPASRIPEVLPGISIATAWRYDRLILKTELPAPSLDNLGALLIDEKHLGKQRGFITLVLNALSGELLYVGEGRGAEALDGFFQNLSREQKAGIVAVGMDRSGAYRKAVETSIPEAEIVYDKFHLIANYNEVIDKVRRRSQAEASREGRAFIKGERYNLFRNPENLTADAKASLKQLLAANRDIAVAYELKDFLKQIWTYSYAKCAEKVLMRWVAIARETGVPEIRRFAKGLENARAHIVSYCRHGITSARIEAFNRTLARVLHKTCGITNLEHFFLKIRQESLQR